MTKRLFLIISTFIFLSLGIPSYVFAADALYRFMHNDHDSLIVGEVIKTDEDLCTIDVLDTIISKSNLSSTSEFSQLIPETVTFNMDTTFKYKFNEHNPQVGDYVLTSINKINDDLFEIAWGMYKVSSTNLDDLTIEISSDSPNWSKMEVAAIESFVHSKGKNTEFSFDGNLDEVTLSLENGDYELIYKAESNMQLSPSENNNIDPNKELDSVKVNETSEADNLTTKTLSDNSFILYFFYCVIAIFIIVTFILIKRRKK